MIHTAYVTSVLEAGETSKCMVTTTNYELILPWLAKTGVMKKRKRGCHANVIQLDITRSILATCSYYARTIEEL